MTGFANIHQQGRSTALYRIIIGLFLLLLLTSCGGGLFGGGDDAAPADGSAVDAAIEAVPQSGTLSCNELCGAEGQCGTRADGTAVVLGHSVQPATRDHDRLFPVNTPLLILNRQPRLVQRITGEQLTVDFFQVQLNDGSVGGWVAGWCVNADQ